MKRVLAVIIALLLLMGTVFAEERREFTAEEQAFDAYLDIAFVYEEGLKYIQEMLRIWGYVLELDYASEADEEWFYYKYMYGDGNGVERGFHILQYAQYRYGIDTSGNGMEALNDVYENAFVPLRNYGAKATDVIWASLALGCDAGILTPTDEMGEVLESAMDGIRNLMKLDREYPFTEDLQEAYKDAKRLYEYLNDFNDNYANLSTKVKEYEGALSDFEADFDFIFDVDSEDYNYVYEARSAEREIKRQAICAEGKALENAGDYEGAIAKYWASGDVGLIVGIRSQIKENDYQRALTLEESGKYREASLAFEMLGDYKDCKERIAELNKYAPLLYTEEWIHSSEDDNVTRYTTHYTYDDAGNLISKKLEPAKSNTYYVYPTEITYTYDSMGRLLTEKEKHGAKDFEVEETAYSYDSSGMLVSSEKQELNSVTDEGWLASTRTIKSTYNKYGDVVSENWTIIDAGSGKVEERATYSRTYTYNDRGDKLTETGANKYGSYSNTYKYVYDDDKLISYSYYPSGTLRYIVTYEYDSVGRLLKEVKESYNNGKKTGGYAELLYTYGF